MVDMDDPQVQGAIAQLERSIVDYPDFPVPPTREVNDPGDLALLTLPFPGESSSRTATDHMATLREDLIPSAFDGVPRKSTSAA